MNDEVAFLRAIAAAPKDDLPRLIYADALDERGDILGEFIRLQIRQAGKDTPSCRDLARPQADWCADCVREWELYRSPDLNLWRFVRWAKPTWTMTGYAREIAFRVGIREGTQDIKCILRRGFVDKIECGFADWHVHGQDIVRASPVCEVRFRDRSPANVRHKSGGSRRYAWFAECELQSIRLGFNHTVPAAWMPERRRLNFKAKSDALRWVSDRAIALAHNGAQHPTNLPATAGSR